MYAVRRNVCMQHVEGMLAPPLLIIVYLLLLFIYYYLFIIIIYLFIIIIIVRESMLNISALILIVTTYVVKILRDVVIKGLDTEKLKFQGQFDHNSFVRRFANSD